MSCFTPLDLGRMDKVCSECGAKHWEGEMPQQRKTDNPYWMSCCLGGRIDTIERLSDPPEYIKFLLSDNGSEAVNFRKNIRQYNICFAFTSVSDNSSRHAGNNGSDSSFMPYKCHGAMYHYQGPLKTEPI